MASALTSFLSAVTAPGGAASSARAGNWAAAGQALAQQAVRSVTIETQFSPPVTIDPLAPAPPSTGTNPLMMLLKPQVTIQGAAGSASFAPYGPPTANYIPWLIGAGLLVLVPWAIGVLAIIARARR